MQLSRGAIAGILSDGPPQVYTVQCAGERGETMGHRKGHDSVALRSTASRHAKFHVMQVSRKS